MSLKNASRLTRAEICAQRARRKGSERQIPMSPPGPKIIDQLEAPRRAASRDEWRRPLSMGLAGSIDLFTFAQSNGTGARVPGVPSRAGHSRGQVKTEEEARAHLS